MNGSLPPSSRLIRATRSMHVWAIDLPVSTEPVNATQSIRGSATMRCAHVARSGQEIHGAGRQMVEERAEHEGRERRELRGLADGAVPGRQRGSELPRKQEKRVVPRHDAGHGAHRLLEDHRELGRLDRRDHPAGEVAAHLCVVVESGSGPADFVAVLDQRLAALLGHHPRDLVGVGAQPDAPPRAASRRARRPGSGPRCAWPRARRPGRPRSARRPGRATAASVSSVNGFSTASVAPPPSTSSPPISSRVSMRRI